MSNDDMNSDEPHHVKEMDVVCGLATAGCVAGPAIRLIESPEYALLVPISLSATRQYVVLPLLVVLFSSPVISMFSPCRVNPMYGWSDIVGCVRRVQREHAKVS